MKVGDYGRTEEGEIIKIEELEDIYTGLGEFITTLAYFKGGYISVEHIIKSRPNKIDLIQEGDILKIEEQKGVYSICEVELFKEPHTNHHFLGVRIDNRPMARRLCELNIKSIVTKEQFSQIEYKVDE